MTAILLIILLLIIAFIFISTGRVPLGKTKKAVVFYLAFLLIAVPVYYVVAEPIETDPAPEPDHSEANDAFWREHDRRVNEFYNAAQEQKLGDFEDAKVVARRDFDYEREKILITSPGFEYYGSFIIIDRKDVNDGKLEITVYDLILPYSSVTVSNPPKFTLEDTNLNILQPEVMHVNEIRLSHDFTMAQFTGKGLRMRIGGVFWGEHQIISIRVPRDLQIEKDKTTEHMIVKDTGQE